MAETEKNPKARKKTIVVGVTGASGAVYSRRLLETLLAGGHYVHLIVSPAGEVVLKEELGMTPAEFRRHLSGAGSRENLAWESAKNMASVLASGSYPTDGMAVCPCSVGTLGAIGSGVSVHLIHRAADVHLKERRRLILVVRETPLNEIHLENMLRVSRAGGVILPASPGFYHRPQRVEDLVDFLVARILDLLGIPHDLSRRWREEEWRASDGKNRPAEGARIEFPTGEV